MRIRIFAVVAAFFVCLPTFADKIVLGKLGQALENASIYSRPSPRSRVYYRVKAYQYLVIKPSRSASYYEVLLQNG